jgi:Acetyltransferase (GNAT) domain
MIVIRRKLRGIVPYLLIYWPTDAAFEEIAENLPWTHYARVESVDRDFDSGRCIVGHYIGLTLLINLQRPLDAIYKDLIDNARIRIHKAEKLGNRLTLRRYSGGADQDRLVPQFVDMYNDVVRGKPRQAVPVSVADEYSFFPNADLLMAYLDGDPICGHLNLVDRDAGIVRLQNSANRRFHDPATARLAGIVNVYLHWYALEKYREEGLATYDFGSLGHAEGSVGVNRFKMQFGGSIIREHHYLLAGMPRAWRSTFNLMSLLRGRWRKRAQSQKAGERWRHLPVEQIQRAIEASIEDHGPSLQARRQTEKYGSTPLARPTSRE